MERLKNDLRVALRGFRRTPAFVVAVLVILGLGIGMAVAMLTTVQAILVRQLPVRDQDRIVVMWPYQVPTAELAPPATDLPELRRASRTMRDIAGVLHYGTLQLPFIDGDRTVVLTITAVTGNYFDVLGARPVLGRLLRPEDEEGDASREMVLSYHAWQSQFGGSPSVIGRQIIEPHDRVTITIVGVAPPGLDYPVGVDSWRPIVRGSTPRIFAVARLAPGASIDAARAELFAIINRLEPTLKLTGAGAETFTTAMLGDSRSILLALTAAVALLLLIACVNVGNLFLVRAASRARELTVRRALGASYGDLVRQLVVESVVLAAAGGALGVACAEGLLEALVAFAPAQLPRLEDVRLHGSLLGVAIGVTALCVLLFGVLPALAAARVNLASPLRHDARSGTETRGRRAARQWLVASQVALALVLLSGAGLLTRSLRQLEQLRLGYRAEHLSVVSVAFDASKYDSDDKAVDFDRRAEERLRAIRGVTAAATINTLPFAGAAINLGLFEAEGQTPTESQANPAVPWETAGEQYFRTLDIPLLRGRGFLDSDRTNAPLVVILSESVSRRFWPTQDPIGKRIRWAPDLKSSAVAAGYPKNFFDWRAVVGVVPDTRFRELRDASPTVYFPLSQFPTLSGNFAVRSTIDERQLSAGIRGALRDVDPTLALWDVRSMAERLAVPLAEPRLSALLFSAFGVVALMLAAVGLYGVMASAVREQTREIGIRMALGATSSLVRGAVLRQAIAVAGVGVCVGVIVALATTRLLRSLLFQVSPVDPITLVAVCIVLLAVTMLAAYLPARRATRVDPASALRSE